MKRQLLLFVTMLLTVIMPMKLWSAEGDPEPYAVLSDNNTKLTFYYDDQKEARGGMNVGPFEDLGSSGVSTEWFGNKSTITTVVFDDSFANCTTLTSTAYWFYQLTKLTTITGIQNLKMDNVSDINSMFSDCESLTSLDLSSLNLSNVTNMHQVFEGCTGLENIILDGVNTENVTNMGDLFLNCRSLKTIDLSSFNTSKVTNMAYMFYRCTSLTTVYVSGSWTTASVTRSESMFERCNNIVGGKGTTFDENHIDASYARIDGGENNPGYFTENNERVINGNFVTTDYSGFAYALEHNGPVIEVTDNNIVEDSENPGDHCVKIVSKDNATEDYDSRFIIRIGEPLKEGQTYKFSMRAKANKNVRISSQAWKAADEYLHYRMLGDFNLTTEWQTYNVEGVVETEQTGCTVISLNLSIDRSSTEYYFDDISFRVYDAPVASPEPYAVLSQENTVLTFYYDTEKETRGGMSVGPFYLGNYPLWYNQRENITTIEFDDSFANCTTLTSTAFWFYNCGKITSVIGISNLKTDNVTNMGWMFSGCSGLTSLDVSGFNTTNVAYMGDMFTGCSGLTSLDVSNFNTANVEDMLNMFYGCSGLTSLDVSRFNTANVTEMSGMFQNCSALTAIDVSNFNTDKVTGMTSMFASCSGLTSLDVSRFNTANVTRMGTIFGNCSSLTSIDVSNFNTTKLTDMHGIFSGCSSLTSLDVSNFNTENVTDMSDMFNSCSSLTSLDVSNFKTEKVTEMNSMFFNCSGLTSLDVSRFNTENVTDMIGMFGYCSSLTRIYAGNGWDTSKIEFSTRMFTDCTSLVGGAGTVYDANHTDHTYAHIDGGTSNPGYFTEKSNSLVAYYPFNGNANDESGHGNHGEVIGNVVLTTDRHGNENGAYQFFGQEMNYISIPDKEILHLNTFTLSAWVYTDADGYGSGSLINKGRDIENGSYRLGVRSVGATNEYGGTNDAGINEFPETGMWHMITGTVEGNVAKYYLDGILMDEKTLTRSFSYSNTEPLTLGMHYYDGVPDMWAYPLRGILDDVRIYNRVLSSSEIADLFAEEGGGIATFNGLVAHVSGTKTLDEAFANVGGRSEAAKSIAAIVWHKTTPLETTDLQGLTDNPNLLVYVNEASLAPQGVQNVVINGVANEIVLTDVQEGNNNFYAPQGFVAERISYTRNFGQSTTKGTSRGWESIALPFDVQTIQHETKGVIVPFNSSASNKHFWLRRLTDNGLQAATNIQANTPYIISMPNSEEYVADYNLNGRVTFAAQNVDVPATVTEVLALADSSIVMVPAMQRQSRSSAVWALNVGEVRGQYFEGSVFERDYRTVRPFEAYTIHRQENGQPAPRYVPIQEIGGTTGIDATLVNSEKVNSEEWYDMQGRKLEGKPARKGVYISNGKKFVVK